MPFLWLRHLNCAKLTCIPKQCPSPMLAVAQSTNLHSGTTLETFPWLLFQGCWAKVGEKHFSRGRKVLVRKWRFKFTGYTISASGTESQVVETLTISLINLLWCILEVCGSLWRINLKKIASLAGITYLDFKNICYKFSKEKNETLNIYTWSFISQQLYWWES